MIKSLPLTPQEESLKQKYAILREKREAAKAAAAAAVVASSEKIIRPPAKRVARVDHQARPKKVASENQSSDKIGFKRSKNLEKRLKEQAKEQKGPRYESWTSSSAATGIDAETPGEERDVDGDQQLPKKPASGKGTGKAMKGLYESFVPASGRPGTVPAIRGKKLFVECWGVKEEDLREAFESIGPLADFDPAPNRGYSFVTYNSIESADLAIKQLNNKQISNCSVKVSFARNQPGSIDISRIEVVEGHVRSKSSAAATESLLKDSRKPVVYDNDPF